jgi:hypothetical protein
MKITSVLVVSNRILLFFIAFMLVLDGLDPSHNRSPLWREQYGRHIRSPLISKTFSQIFENFDECFHGKILEIVRFYDKKRKKFLFISIKISKSR